MLHNKEESSLPAAGSDKFARLMEAFADFEITSETEDQVEATVCNSDAASLVSRFIAADDEKTMQVDDEPDFSSYIRGLYLDAFDEADSPHNIVYRSEGDGYVVAASFIKLIEKITSSLDFEFVNDVILTFRTVIKPEDLAFLLILRFNWSLGEADEAKSVIRVRTFVVMRDWIDSFADVDLTKNVREIIENGLSLKDKEHSIRDERMIIKLHTLIKEKKGEETMSTSSSKEDDERFLTPISMESEISRCQSKDTIKTQKSSLWKKRFSARLGALNFKPSFSRHSTGNTNPLSELPTHSNRSSVISSKYNYMANQEESFIPVNILAMKSAALAEALCMIEHEIICNIGIIELLEWKKSHAFHGNILAAIKRFNLTTQWISNQVLNQTKISDQTKVIAKLIRAAVKCFELHNFNSTIAITLGLQSPQLGKLKEVWRSLAEHEYTYFQSLVDFCSPLKNFKKIRDAMNQLDGDKHPCIPFIGLFLSDLTFAYEQPNFIGETMINVHKLRILAGIIKKFKRFQESPPYAFSVDEKVHRTLIELE